MAVPDKLGQEEEYNFDELYERHMVGLVNKQENEKELAKLAEEEEENEVEAKQDEEENEANDEN